MYVLKVQAAPPSTLAVLSCHLCSDVVTILFHVRGTKGMEPRTPAHCCP